jgi:cellobiose phosphorylase
MIQAIWQRIRQPGGSRLPRLEGVKDVEPPLREGLFTGTQLEGHARSLATDRTWATRPGLEMLLRRLAENESIIRQSYEDLAEAVRQGRPLTPAARWLVENYTFIEEQIDQVRLIFPAGYSRQLPRLSSGPLKGLPRIYEMAYELVSHTDGRVDAENISQFVRAYQTVHPLKLGELWAVPIMISLALVENLRRVSRRIAWRRRHRESAVEWSQRFIQAVGQDPKSLITILADFVRSEPLLSAPFLAELTSSLQGTHPAMGLVVHWVEQELSERGQTLELIQQAESQDQAADHASISNSVTSLRQLTRIDWRDMVESLSAVEAILRRDPGGVHPLMDFRSRDLCRREIEGLSRRSGQEEQDVARRALRIATQRAGIPGIDPREGTVGYFLIGDGRAQLEAEIRYRPYLRQRVGRRLRRRALPLYLLTIMLLTTGLWLAVMLVVGSGPTPGAAPWPDGWWWLVLTSLAVILVASRTAVSLVNWCASLLVPPRPLPRMDFAKGIPDAYRTAVIVPAMLSSSATVDKLVESLELRYLGNRSPNLLMVLLTDFPDAHQEQMPEDKPLLDRALGRIRELNAKYAGSGIRESGIGTGDQETDSLNPKPDSRNPVFFLLHRPRLWNPSQWRWMGFERKRGKIEDFNRLVVTGAAEPFSLVEGDIALLRSVQYAIVLDADTQLPPQAAWKMVGAIAHPLNRPCVDSAHQCVTRGYGILQPRLAVSLPQSQRSRFARLYSGDVGLDPYTREVSNVYQDLFGQGQFVGKAIYDIKAFDTAVSTRFPENRILSHDLIEGCHARCGFLGDVELLEDHPERYLADANRRRRWTRGDWQIARWLLPGVPGPGMTRRKNPLPILAKWLILDNLRRSLVAAAMLAAFLLGWFGLPSAAWTWTAMLVGVFFLPDFLRSVRTLASKPRHLSWSTYLPYAGIRELRGWVINLLELLLTPFHAAIYLVEILRTQWRLITRRNLLEWQTASDAGSRAGTTLASTFLAMWTAPVASAAVAALLAWRVMSGDMQASPESIAVEGLLLAAWFVSPAILWYLGRPTLPPSDGVNDRQRLFLRKTARRTWEYFARFASAGNHWLPPDNFQQDPPIGEAPRTSPTNMGMSLLSNLAAWDFGYVSVGTLLDRTSKAFQTMEELPRHRGHFLNWYDTQTLEPAPPRYVSTADSGNLSGVLVALKTGLAELGDRPILPPRWRQGLEDVLGIVLEELRRSENAETPEAVRTTVVGQMELLRSAGDTLSAAYGTLSALAAAAAQMEPMAPPESEIAYWLGAVRRQSEDLRADLDWLAPWLQSKCDAGVSPACGEAILASPDDVAQGSTPGKNKDADKMSATHEGKMPASPTAQPFPLGDSIPSLRDLAGPANSTPTAQAAGGDAFELAREHAIGRIAVMEDLAQRCGEMSEMDLDFLYDPEHKLLSIGYNVDAHQRDPGFYDLLASESRLCSFLGIARGQVPLEHWFHLGRQLAPGGRAAVLISWSGSMFEYLMPLLLMPNYDATLLDQSCREAVARQERYGLRHGVPWGISESCYNQLDSHKAYQYRAFGVPGMGLKHGLHDDLVVAPYATVLAMMIDPGAACANLEAMVEQGFLGRYGFYEAADYTPDRVPPGQNFSLVRSHMAHHSGMSLLALDQALLSQPMHGRFLSDPRIRASLLLLQERIPLAEVRTRIEMTSAEPYLKHAAESVDTSLRSFTTANSPVPEVHLLSNGRYHVMVTVAGSGASRWQDLALTRWQEDATRDHWGTFLYVRDLDAGTFWSATPQPAPDALRAEFDRFEAQFSQGVAEFLATREDIQLHMRVAVSSEDDVELRRLIVSNLSNRDRHIEITSYAEVAMLNGPNASEQPAFNGLFIEAEALPAKAAVVCTRRTRSPEENWPLFFHGMFVHRQPISQGVSCETDRSRFLGRGRTTANPAAMSGEFPETCGPTLDPIMSVRRTIRLEPGQSVTIDAVWGVAPQRAAALTLLDRYCDPHLATRVFELARMHSQILLHELQATEANAQLFGRMACFLAYANPRLRARASLISRNRKGQSALWTYGISGDLPIVLLRISDPTALDLVRQMIQAHAYWRHKGLKVDLVILSEAYAGYRHSLLDAIIGLINVGPESKALDQPAGIFVRNVAQVPEEDTLLLQAVSRIVLSDRAGTLSEQLDRQVLPEWEALPLKPTRPPERAPRHAPELTRRDLKFFNGWGGFTTDGREYVVVLERGGVTPAPWVNVLANPNFGSVVSESGAAYTWYQNAHEFRLTPWYNDAVSDVSGECFYLRDEESGAFWSPMPGPARGRTAYVSRHGLGYTAFEHSEQGIFSETFVYVSPEAPLKFIAVNIRNTSARNRRLSLTGYVEWVLGESRQRNAMHVVTRLDPQTGAIFASNAYGLDFSGAVAFLHCNHPQRTITGRRTEFLGRNGSPAKPAAMTRKEFSNRVGSGADPCAAIQAYIDIPPGEQAQVVFVLGAADSEHQARSLLAQHGGVDGARRVLEEVWEFWKRNLGGVYVETPDASVNLLVNHWLLYQTLACRMWGRTGFYQSGGAYGFRDQLQDSLSLLYECPWVTRQQLVLSSSRQFQNGDVQHWWHPPSGRGVRTRISDDYLWLPYAVCRYVAVTGDTGILDEQTAFLEAPPLEPGEESRYALPRVSDRRATLWDHCVRALDRGMRYGAHGMPFMGSGDWNDGMNRVGRQGAGESVWLAFFLYDVLNSFAKLAQKRGDTAYAQKCLLETRGLSERIDANAWDGRWYLRAFFDDGRPLGSAQNTQCQIDLLPQAWAVISQAADPDRARQALETTLARLVDPDAAMIRLFEPPFDGTEMDPGYIRGYVAGVRENGGQYTHAAVWAVMAMARLGNAQEAWRLFSMLNPIRHADSHERASKYKVEPYVLAADVYSAKGHQGRGGWTWYTGSAGWMYRLLVEDLLGLRLDVDTLTFWPLLPEDWNEYTLHYRYRSTFYHIRVVKMSPLAAQVHRVVLDGTEQPDNSIHLVDDGKEHPAVVEIADSPKEVRPPSDHAGA